MFDIEIVTESDIQTQKHEWQVASTTANPAMPTLIVRYVTINVTGNEGTKDEGQPWTPADGPAMNFCEGWQAYKHYGQNPPSGVLATIEAQWGLEEAHGMATKVTWPIWGAHTYQQGWDTYRYFRPVGALIRSNEALRGWKEARADHQAWDVDKYEVTL